MVWSGGEISDFDPAAILGKRGLLDLDRSTKLFLSSVELALDDANMEINGENSSQVGLSVGTTFGVLDSYCKFQREAIINGPRYANPSLFPQTIANAPAGRAGIRFKIKGFNTTISTGMCAALDALKYACDFINSGRIHTAIAGAVEPLSIEIFAGLHTLRCLSGSDGGQGPVSCPFDKRRNGIVLSEGAVSFIAEDKAGALLRKAHIYGEILSMVSCFDPQRLYRYSPNGLGMVKAMRMALEHAEVRPKDIDCIFANANSTLEADQIEARAINEVFGDAAKKVLVTSVKSNLGETFSASGGFSLAAALGAIEKGFVPPLINYEQRDPMCVLNFALGGNPNSLPISRVMVNTFSMNGANSVAVIGKCE
jgi:3-oxoacyl-[acyl-carrier-protein] synthase II